MSASFFLCAFQWVWFVGFACSWQRMSMCPGFSWYRVVISFTVSVMILCFLFRKKNNVDNTLLY